MVNKTLPKKKKKIKGRLKEVKLQKTAGEDQATRDVLNFCDDELIIWDSQT